MSGLSGGNPSNSLVAAVCFRCERIRVPGGIWITVEQEGVYATHWEFCCIECLGSHFEADVNRWLDPRETA